MTLKEQIEGAADAATNAPETPAQSAPGVTDDAPALVGAGDSLPQSPAPATPPDVLAKLEAAEAEIERLKAEAADGASLEERVKDLTARSERQEAALKAARRHSLLSALAEVPDDVRGMVADQIGDVDVSTENGRAMVQQFLASRPSLVQRRTAGEQATVLDPSHFDQLRKSPFAPAIDMDSRRRLYAEAGGRGR